MTKFKDKVVWSPKSSALAFIIVTIVLILNGFVVCNFWYCHRKKKARSGTVTAVDPSTKHKNVRKRKAKIRVVLADKRFDANKSQTEMYFPEEESNECFEVLTASYVSQ